MEEKIEILIQYGKADLDERLNLFLRFPDLRWAFQEMELKDLVAQRASKSLGEQNKKGKWFRLLSFIGRITDMETRYKLLRPFEV
jgi:hypothetical protein